MSTVRFPLRALSPVRRVTVAAALALGALLAAPPAAADPGYYVVTVYDDPGRRVVDARYWTVDTPRAPATLWPELGVGWNVTGPWYTCLVASWIGGDQPTQLSSLNWQNDVVLTGGRWPVDVALHTMLVKPMEAGERGMLLEWGPALQTDIGRTQLNFNAIFERGFGGQATKPTQLKYQWQVRHRWQPWLHFGAQGFGELGNWNDWAPHARQSHRAGPALFGKLEPGGQRISWQAAYLVGRTYRKSGSMFTARLAYEF